MDIRAMSSLVRCLSLTVVLSMILAVPSMANEASNLDARAKALLADFKAVKNQNDKTDTWNPRTGPWGPYLKESMIAALSAREKSLFHSAMTLGDCQSVIALQSTGFLLAHPFLQAAHAKPLVGEIFIDTVVKKSLDSRYCLWRREYADALANLAMLDIANVLPVKLKSARLSDPGEPEYDSQVRTLVNSLCTALKGFAALAIHDDHREAIKDLVNLNERKDIARLPPPEEFYLIERAAALGIEAHVRTKRLDLLYHKLKPDERTSIERYARDREGLFPLGLGWHCPPPPRDAGTPSHLPFWLQK